MAFATLDDITQYMALLRLDAEEQNRAQRKQALKAKALAARSGRR